MIVRLSVTTLAVPFDKEKAVWMPVRLSVTTLAVPVDKEKAV
jgi:hypothetical protein